MNKEKRREIEFHAQVERWEYACQHYYHLNEKNALLWVERGIDKKIKKIAREDKDGTFKEAMHRVIDKKNSWHRRIRTMINHPKCTQYREELPGHGIVISLLNSGAITIDVGTIQSYMRMEYLYAKDNFSSSVLASLQGRRLEEVFVPSASMRGVINPDRKIVRASAQLGKTVIKFEEEEQGFVTYKQLFGDPLKRYQNERIKP
jgi:hypothetical protein